MKQTEESMINETLRIQTLYEEFTNRINDVGLSKTGTIKLSLDLLADVIGIENREDYLDLTEDMGRLIRKHDKGMLCTCEKCTSLDND